MGYYRTVLLVQFPTFNRDQKMLFNVEQIFLLLSGNMVTTPDEQVATYMVVPPISDCIGTVSLLIVAALSIQHPSSTTALLFTHSLTRSLWLIPWHYMSALMYTCFSSNPALSVAQFRFSSLFSPLLRHEENIACGVYLFCKLWV